MPPSDDEDALFASLESEANADPTLTALRERRIQALSQTLAAAKTARNEGFGTYMRIRSEKDLLDITTSSSYKRCIVHFYKEDFNRCRIMDGHLQALAEKHLEARFLRMGVEEAPFLVTRLGVRVLPCVIGFLDGVGVFRVVGFEGLGVGDEFRTEVLEGKFVECEVLEGKEGIDGLDSATRHGEGFGPRGRAEAVEEDDGDDWD